MHVPTATPRVLSDATEVMAHPERYADRPTLVDLARRVLASNATRPAPLLRRIPAPAQTAAR